MQKNVILITIDSLRHDSVGFLNPECKLTPYLDKLASRSTIMTNAFAAGGGTIYAMSALMTSALPITTVGDKTIRGWPTLAQSFKSRGYHTAAFHSNPWLSQPFGFDQGYDLFRYIVPSMRVEDVVDVGPLATRIPEAISEFTSITIKDAPLWIRARDLFNRATRWVDGLPRDEPYFLWVHPMDIHFPYTYPSSAVDRLSPSRMLRYGFDFLVRYSDNNLVNALGKRFSLIEEYRRSIRYLDRILEDFCEKFPDAMIIIMADHGDLFGEHGCYQHPGELYNEIIRVPILVYDRDSQPKTIRNNYSTVEVGGFIKSLAKDPDCVVEPTVSDMFSIHVDYGTALRRTSLVRGAMKLIVTEDTRMRGPGKFELFDIARDPKELYDLGSGSPDVRKELDSARTGIMKEAERQKLKLSMRRLAPILQKKTTVN